MTPIQPDSTFVVYGRPPRKRSIQRVLLLAAGRGELGLGLAAPMSPPKDDRRRILAEAIASVGRERLAERLGVAEALLVCWVRGEEAVPDGVMLQVATILDGHARREG